MSDKPPISTFYGTLIYETGFRDTAAYLIAGFRDSAEVLRQRNDLWNWKKQCDADVPAADSSMSASMSAPPRIYPTDGVFADLGY